MRVRDRLIVFVSVLTCAVLSLSGTAFAGYARQGDDYSFTYNRNRQVAICDMERDATRVYSQFYRFGSGWGYRVYDENGALRGCSGSRWGKIGIRQHSACEDRRFLPDPCRVSYH